MDAGCTAWTSQIAATILGHEIAARRELFFLSDPSDPHDLLKWLAGYLAAGERLDARLRLSIDFAVHGKQFMVEGLRNTAETAARLAGRIEQQAYATVRDDGIAELDLLCSGFRPEHVPALGRDDG